MKNLSFYRKKIDKIDKKIVKDLQKRNEIVSGIAQYKLENNLTIENTSREEEILKNIKNIVSEEESEYIVEIYKTIFSESKKYQKKLNEEVNR